MHQVPVFIDIVTRSKPKATVCYTSFDACASFAVGSEILQVRKCGTLSLARVQADLRGVEALFTAVQGSAGTYCFHTQPSGATSGSVVVALEETVVNTQSFHNADGDITGSVDNNRPK